MKLFVFVACLVAALGASNGQQYSREGSMGMQRPSGMMASQGGSMSARGMMAGGMAGGRISASESEEMQPQEMPSGMMSANQGGLSRGGKMESGMMRSSGMMRGSTMMRASDMESDKKMSSGMSGMRPMGMERSMAGESMSMRKESGGMMSSRKSMSSERSSMTKSMMTEPRMEMRPKKGMMMDSENLEKVRMMKKEEMRAHGILDEASEVSPDGYMYKYKTEDGVDAFQTGTLSRGRSADEASMKVEGMYTWTAPNGHVYKVEYMADEDGFHPRITSRA